MTEPITVGLSEKITVHGEDGKEEIQARIDTGATTSSIDARVAARLRLGPIVTVKKVKNSNGIFIRPAIEVLIEIKGKKCKGMFTIADRSHLTYDALIGQDILTQGFLIDPSKE